MVKKMYYHQRLMLKRVVFVVVILVILFGIYFVLTPQQTQIGTNGKAGWETSGQIGVGETCECDKANEKVACTTASGYSGTKTCDGCHYGDCYVASLDDCLLTPDRDYVICCLSQGSSGDLVYCNDKREFNAGDYVIIKVDLDKAMRENNVDYDPYKACSFEKIIAQEETELPEHYEKGTCSNAFYLKDERFYAGGGYVPDTTGSMEILKLMAFPAALDLSTPDKISENLDSGTEIFSLKINIS